MKCIDLLLVIKVCTVLGCDSFRRKLKMRGNLREKAQNTIRKQSNKLSKVVFSKQDKS